MNGEAISFGDALVALKNGKCVERLGWNGKSMYLFLVDGSVVTGWVSCDNGAANRLPLNRVMRDGTLVTYRPHIAMKAVDGSVGPWVASQTDMLAEDWRVVEPEVDRQEKLL